jgi:hypothetical protein
MRPLYLYCSVLLLGLTTFYLFYQADQNPEIRILGSWQEIDWQYERVDVPGRSKEITANLREAIGKHLYIHEAEQWQFFSDGTLILRSDKKETIAGWKLKGRGNILQITYGRDAYENYTLATLEDGRMDLHFEADIQARGIARLRFEKTNTTDATQIQ